MADTPLSIITLHSEVTRLRTALDDVAHAHERDLMRLAVALGFDHEPPSNVDAMVAEVEALRTQRDFAANRLRAVVAIVSRGNDDATARAAAQRLHDLGHPDMASRLIAWRESEAEVERLRAILEGRTTPPTDAEIHEHADRGGAWLVTLPAVKQVRSKPETRYTDDPREVSRLWWSEGARWVAVLAGRPTAWPVVTEGGAL